MCRRMDHGGPRAASRRRHTHDHDVFCSSVGGVNNTCTTSSESVEGAERAGAP